MRTPQNDKRKKSAEHLTGVIPIECEESLFNIFTL